MMFEAKTSGIMPVKAIVMTVLGVRMTSPSTRNIQPNPNPITTSRRSASIDTYDAAFRPVAEEDADEQDKQRSNQMAQDVTHHQPGEGRQRPDRQ